MLSFDTNLLFYALAEGSPSYTAARSLLEKHQHDTSVVIAEPMLVELYNLLRNERLIGRKIGAKEAVGHVGTLRTNPSWALVENAPVMDKVWGLASKPNFPRRKIYDLRLGLTLIHHGVTHFATANVKDFKGLGFEEVWNPLASQA